MKIGKTLAVLTVAASCALVPSAFGQGTIFFQTIAAGAAPAGSFVTDTDGVTKLDGSLGYTAQLLISTDGISFTPFGSAIAFGTGADIGLFSAPSSYTLPGGYPSGNSRFFRVLASGTNGLTGTSATFTLTPGAGVFDSPTLAGVTIAGTPTTPASQSMPAFSLVPEPGSIALAALGAVSLIFLRRRK
jgi:hypothetical protein